MTKTINFNQFLSPQGRQFGYIRKILAIEEFENNEPDQHYGVIKESHYYPAGEREAIPCKNGDCFVISDIIDDPNFNLKLFTYYLIQVNLEAEPQNMEEKEHHTNGYDLRLLNCTCRVGGFDATDFPRPEHLFVETLLTKNLFQ